MLILNRLQGVALLLLRICVGLIFLAHGWTKVSDMSKTMTFFASLGFPGWMAVLIGLLEVAGGLLLILGIFTRIFGILFTVEMIVAILAVHWKQGPWWRVAGYELPRACLGMSFALVAFGAGVISLDRIFLRGRA